MKDIFSRAASFESDGSPVIHVETNGYGTLNRDSTARYLLTTGTAVCTGLALVSEDKSHFALTHIFCVDRYVTHGEEAVKRHTKNLWDIFESKLLPGQKYHATAFGGNGMSAGTDAEFAQFLEDLSEHKRKKNIYFEFDKKLPFPYECYKNNPERRASCPDYKKAILYLKSQSVELEEIFNYYRLREGRDLSTKAALIPSAWIGNSFYDAAMASGRILSAEDQRFQDAPHSALIDARRGRVYLSRDHNGNSDLEEKFPRGTPIEKGEKLIQGYQLTS